jgi:hypothetical protein
MELDLAGDAISLYLGLSVPPRGTMYTTENHNTQKRTGYTEKAGGASCRSEEAWTPQKRGRVEPGTKTMTSSQGYKGKGMAES